MTIQKVYQLPLHSLESLDIFVARIRFFNKRAHPGYLMDWFGGDSPWAEDCAVPDDDDMELW